ncbi:major facilitator superfamily transport protein [Francisella tularensis subsp. novicida GA99-3548]|uniref:MFS transporter n=1 Tax=Francisella tularensis TaxID=263 RepID=UPI000158B437|nr:MFS transporter [Francisella tularensis]AEE87561.1 Major facilitator superfamily (MFS) transport protein [Francisella cf. novicida Fx1]AJI72743.1 sugar (and other) transporter family protein [Francisella tularensis subsp. novicida D9876]APA83295.1 Sialic acid transporter (permease) NanT [Francisella tularensis subsp. novicida PA10-7858]AVC44087.1 MFS transporter [Francisella tularensis subsp. novicida]EDN37908.1 major facilitator superfamily transport protein [Francisella tularensis subsp. 
MKSTKWILVILCLGYFIDFYDLTVFSVSYVDLLKQQFGIFDSTKIQQTYYLINNIQMVGILVGAIFFGILADKFGRITVIKYSILLYSLTTLLCIFVNNIYIFMLLRFLSYLALASEFAVSSVLIVEFFPPKLAAWGMSLLYILGVLGGIFATFLGVFSYKIMFIFGGFAGLGIYAFRRVLEESPYFIELYTSDRFKNAGSIVFLLRNYSKPLILNFLITLPYFFVITVMLALVKFIATDIDFASLVKMFLFGFFVGNIISCIFSGIYNQYFKSPNLFFIGNIIIFLTSIFAYRYISSNFIFLYGIFIGLIGGGYNIMWAQYAATEFPTEVRSLACNMIFALGRTSSIFFGIIFAYWITNESSFRMNVNILAVVVAIMVLLIIMFYKREKILNK